MDWKLDAKTCPECMGTGEGKATDDFDFPVCLSCQGLGWVESFWDDAAHQDIQRMKMEMKGIKIP